MATSRNFKNISATTTPAKMAAKYTTMLNAVSNMITKEGPIYSTWIRFQIGKNNPITFDSTSNNKKENMIAGLTFNKKGAGVVNDFELIIRYDPFDYGQNTTDKIELLDELIADAMSYDIHNDIDRLRGYIQYGYNCPTDSTLISPKYQFILTNASSSVDWSTGIAEYTFEGTTDLAADANFTTAIPKFENEYLIDIVTTVLWAFYGKESEEPVHRAKGVSFHENEYGYKIEVDDDLRLKSPKITVNAVSKQSPWLYVQNLLDTYMSEEDKNVEEYQSDKITQNQKPRYAMFITDEAGAQAIHITYVSPKEQDKNVKIDYQFTWGLKSQNNLVLKWNPETDLRLYLLQQSIKKRNDVLLKTNPSEAEEFMKLMNSSYLENVDVFEMYDATLTLIGIPADIPLAAEVTVMPRILESVSRTAGIYMIQGGVDRIATSGSFSSELKLLRIRGINEPPITKTQVKSKTTNKDTSSVSSSSNANTTQEDVNKVAETPAKVTTYSADFIGPIPIDTKTSATYNRTIQPSVISTTKFTLVSSSSIKNITKVK